ncbi:MAG: GIY-YIG nuclease family protein [Clostridiales bacterium]|nr:GIY-YIG nuclease family protein [Clostridiales bacterium]
MSLPNTYYVYILSNKTDVALYVGVTNDLLRRVREHRMKIDPKSFTSLHDIGKLVYYETTNDIHSAIAREKQIKSWKRWRKNELVESKNSRWIDLYEILTNDHDFDPLSGETDCHVRSLMAPSSQ